MPHTLSRLEEPQHIKIHYEDAEGHPRSEARVNWRLEDSEVVIIPVSVTGCKAHFEPMSGNILELMRAHRADLGLPADLPIRMGSEWPEPERRGDGASDHRGEAHQSM